MSECLKFQNTEHNLELGTDKRHPGVCDLRYFDSQEEKDEWLNKTKKDFGRRKKESKRAHLLHLKCMPEHGDFSGYPAAYSSSSTELLATDRSHIVDDDGDEYAPTGEDDRKRKYTTAMIYSSYYSSEYEENPLCNKSSRPPTNFVNSTELLELPNKQPDRFRMLSAQVVWKCSTCDHSSQGPSNSTCSCPPIPAIPESGMLPALATLGFPRSVTTALYPAESAIAATPVVPEKGEEFLDELMGMMNKNAEIEERKEALQDATKQSEVKINDHLIGKVENKTKESKIGGKDIFCLLSAQVMWKCSTCDNCQGPSNNTCCCPPFAEPAKLPAVATLDPSPHFDSSTIAATPVVQEKGEEFLDDLMGMMNKTSEIEDRKRALQDITK